MNLHHAWHGVDPEDFPQDPTHPGIYFMQNTMVRGGGNGQPGKKMKLGVREKNEKGERKKEGNYIKKGVGASNMHILGAQLKPRPPQTYLSGEKINHKRGGGNNQNEQYVSLESSVPELDESAALDRQLQLRHVLETKA